jgi:hypothetical protein
MGYAIGALLTGIIADFFNIETAIGFIGFLTLLSALVIQYRMSCKSEDLPLDGLPTAQPAA